MRDFHSLKVWEKSHAFALAVYKACEGFPRAEQYGLTSQLQRAALSIPTNIAEGSGYESDAQFIRFLEIALGSAQRVRIPVAVRPRYGLSFLGNLHRLERRCHRNQAHVDRLAQIPAPPLNADT